MEETSKADGISSLIELVKLTKTPRYKIINGRRIKSEDYQSMDEFEQLDLSPLDLKELDDELNALNFAWTQAEDDLTRQILFLKFELKIETYFQDEAVLEPNLISKLQSDLANLEKLVNANNSTGFTV